MEEIKTLKENYEKGFITAHEFLCGYSDVLAKLGAQGELTEVMNTILAPLADFVVYDILNAEDFCKKQIKDLLTFK